MNYQNYPAAQLCQKTPVLGTKYSVFGSMSFNSPFSKRLLPSKTLRLVIATFSFLFLGLTGCQTVVNPYDSRIVPPVPEEMAIGREQSKVSLPAYRIEPPDIISIEMLKIIPLPPYRAEVFDVLQIRANAPPDQPIENYYMIEAEGTINLGPQYGSVRVAGMTIDEIRATLDKWLRQYLTDPSPSVQLARVSGAQP